MASLQMLHLGQNCLTGPIPSSVGNLAHLVILVLSFNSLTGTVPAEIGNLTALQDLDLNNNQLEGGLPETMSLLNDLYYLSLKSNNFTGGVPNFRSTRLIAAELDGNSFSGGFPDSLCHFACRRHWKSWIYQATNFLVSSLAAYGTCRNSCSWTCPAILFQGMYSLHPQTLVYRWNLCI